jgi:hypothetical protein
LNRRQFVRLGFGSTAIVLVASSCASSAPKQTEQTASTDAAPEDFSARFSGFEPAEEPNGDPSKVEWPSFVTDAGSDVQALYEFQITHGDLMRYMPCFCGCGEDAGHRSNRDCYVQSVTADGSVVLDSMAPT